MLTMRQVCAVLDVGSAWAPVIPPVFKTGGRPFRATVCSTHMRFRQIHFGGKFFSDRCRDRSELFAAVDFRSVRYLDVHSADQPTLE